MSSHTYLHSRGVSRPFEVSWVTADEGATFLVLLDEDAGYMKAVPAAGENVTDYLVESGKRFIEQFFRRRVPFFVVTENPRLWNPP